MVFINPKRITTAVCVMLMVGSSVMLKADWYPLLFGKGWLLPSVMFMAGCIFMCYFTALLVCILYFMLKVGTYTLPYFEVSSVSGIFCIQLKAGTFCILLQAGRYPLCYVSCWLQTYVLC